VPIGPWALREARQASPGRLVWPNGALRGGKYSRGDAGQTQRALPRISIESRQVPVRLQNMRDRAFLSRWAKLGTRRLTGNYDDVRDSVFARTRSDPLG